MHGLLTPPLKWHGGKFYLARRICESMPPHTHYVEPYFGGGQVLFRKNPEGVSEVANDVDGTLMNFWGVLQDRVAFEEFIRTVTATPFAEPAFEAAEADLTSADPVRRAVALFIRCRMSLAGRMTSFTAVTRTRVRRGMNNETSAWLSVLESLPAVHERLKRVLILNRPALEVIEKHDTPGTLFYLDPPYLHETRTAPDVYRYEMSEGDHRQLLDLVRGVKGKVLLSGYPSELYDAALEGWRRETFNLANHAAGGKAKGRETEVLWMNF
jgi:DNA adenine methylase